MLAELRAAWASLRGRHPGERFYCFGLYTTDLADYLMVTASTEEGAVGGHPALRDADRLRR